MTKYRKPFSIGRLNKIYRILTGIYAWSPIIRRFTMNDSYDSTETKINTCIKVLEEWKSNLK